MKVSRLIAKLQLALQKHGDNDVVFRCEDFEMEDVVVYPEGDAAKVTIVEMCD